ncbi:hypothetical protein OC844_007602 [Tilletia horrida]|nr:hypothetical protein OC844_007602 [Tilletia horrida]
MSGPEQRHSSRAPLHADDRHRLDPLTMELTFRQAYIKWGLADVRATFVKLACNNNPALIEMWASLLLVPVNELSLILNQARSDHPLLSQHGELCYVCARTVAPGLCQECVKLATDLDVGRVSPLKGCIGPPSPLKGAVLPPRSPPKLVSARTGAPSPFKGKPDPSRQGVPSSQKGKAKSSKLQGRTGLVKKQRSQVVCPRCHQVTSAPTRHICGNAAERRRYERETKLAIDFRAASAKRQQRVDDAKQEEAEYAANSARHDAALEATIKRRHSSVCAKCGAKWSLQWRRHPERPEDSLCNQCWAELIYERNMEQASTISPTVALAPSPTGKRYQNIPLNPPSSSQP